MFVLVMFNQTSSVNASFYETLLVDDSKTSLDLRGKNIGDDGALSLSAALKINDTLTNSDLSENNIGDVGASAISEALDVK